MTSKPQLGRYQKLWMVEVTTAKSTYWQATGAHWHGTRKEALAAMREAEKMWSPKMRYRVTRYEATR